MEFGFEIDCELTSNCRLHYGAVISKLRDAFRLRFEGVCSVMSVFASAKIT
jgi:hypothetical protein